MQKDREFGSEEKCEVGHHVYKKPMIGDGKWQLNERHRNDKERREKKEWKGSRWAHCDGKTALAD